jgi:hypothetical protein
LHLKIQDGEGEVGVLGEVLVEWSHSQDESTMGIVLRYINRVGGLREEGGSRSLWLSL